MTIANRLLQIGARFLDHPVLAFSNRQVNLQSESVGWQTTWDLRNTRFLRAATNCPKLCVIRIGLGSKPVAEFMTFDDHFRAALSRCGLNINAWGVRGILPGATTGRNALSAALDLEWANLGRPRLVLIVLESKDTRLYSDVKWWGDCHAGVPTICVTYQTMSMRNRHNPSQTDQNMLGNLR